MNIELWPVDRPKPYAKNARKWGTNAVEKVASSIREYGFRQPIVVDPQDTIIIGHLRLAAAKKLELKEVPVHVARDLSPEQVKGLRLGPGAAGARDCGLEGASFRSEPDRVRWAGTR